MARINVAERTARVVSHLRDWSGPELDVLEECKDEWTKDYAIIEVTVVEPESIRYFALESVWEDVKAQILEGFGKGHALRTGSLRDNGLERRRVEKSFVELVWWPKMGGWNAELEVIRQEPWKTVKKVRKWV